VASPHRLPDLARSLFFLAYIFQGRCLPVQDERRAIAPGIAIEDGVASILSTPLFIVRFRHVNLTMPVSFVSLMAPHVSYRTSSLARLKQGGNIALISCREEHIHDPSQSASTSVSRCR
jgi:hypothetical protein